MRIRVKRVHLEPEYTVSDFCIDGVFQCYVLEDAVREVKGVPVSKWKIATKTAIPAGTYNVIVNWSEHFQQMLPLIENVEGFTGIRIHKGNTAGYTDGCLLLGMAWLGDAAILRSKDAFNLVFSLIQGAWSRGEKITLEIS